MEQWSGCCFGALSAMDAGPQVGVGIGIALGYIVWIALMGDGRGSLRRRCRGAQGPLLSDQTIETSKETLAWLQSKMPPGTGS